MSRNPADPGHSVPAHSVSGAVVELGLQAVVEVVHVEDRAFEGRLWSSVASCDAAAVLVHPDVAA